VLGIILGGGAGTRLYPLTKKRAKPAVPLGANYRLIDIPVSNCINSNVTKIYCLTQFNSASLNRHLSLAYNSSVTSVSRGFVEVLAASQSSESKNWFQGTADAVRQYMWLFEEAVRDGVQDFLVLSGEEQAGRALLGGAGVGFSRFFWGAVARARQRLRVLSFLPVRFLSLALARAPVSPLLLRSRQGPAR